jgi:hypothetical protein
MTKGAKHGLGIRSTLQHKAEERLYARLLRLRAPQCPEAADRSLTFVDSIVARSRAVDDRPPALHAAPWSSHQAESI